MKAYNDAQADFDQLIEIDETSAGCPEISGVSRQRVQDALELVLINPDVWQLHCDLLRDKLQVERHRDLLSDDERNDVCSCGLAALDDSKLAILTLNRNALQDLVQAIDDSSPISDVWVDAISRHGRQILNERGLTELRGSRLINAALEQLNSDQQAPTEEDVTHLSIVTRSEVRANNEWKTEDTLSVRARISSDSNPNSLLLNEAKPQDTSTLVTLDVPPPVDMKLHFTFPTSQSTADQISIGCMPEIVFTQIAPEWKDCSLAVEQDSTARTFRLANDGVFEPTDASLTVGLAQFILTTGNTRFSFTVDLASLHRRAIESLG